MQSITTESNRATKEYIKKAMLHLLSQKPYEKITITDLVNKAGVSRTAFYRNYATKDKLLSEMLLELSKFSLLKPSSEFTKEKLTQVFRNILTEKKEFTLLFRAMTENFPLVLHNEIVNQMFVGAIEKQTYPEAIRYGVFHGIFIQWIVKGMKESPEELAEIAYPYLA